MTKGKLFHLYDLSKQKKFFPDESRFSADDFQIIARLLYISNQEGLKGNRLSDFELIESEIRCKCEKIDESSKETDFQKAMALA